MNRPHHATVSGTLSHLPTETHEHSRAETCAQARRSLTENLELHEEPSEPPERAKRAKGPRSERAERARRSGMGRSGDGDGGARRRAERPDDERAKRANASERSGERNERWTVQTLQAESESGQGVRVLQNARWRLVGPDT